MSLQLFARNGFTYGKLFHQLEEIVSELSPLLMEITFGRSPKFFSGVLQLHVLRTSFERARGELSNGTLGVP